MAGYDDDGVYVATISYADAAGLTAVTHLKVNVPLPGTSSLLLAGALPLLRPRRRR